MDSELTPFPEPSLASQAELPPHEFPQAPPILPPEPEGPWLENPSWTGLDLVLLTLIFLFALVLFSAVAAIILKSMHLQVLDPVTRSPSVWVAIPPMFAAYLELFAVLYVLAHRRRVPLWPALSWNWPSGPRCAGLIFGGMALAIVAGLLDKLLPVPKSLPIEEIFLQRGAPQLLAVFGVAVAPIVEETMFRGLLYPVTNRWFRRIFARMRFLPTEAATRMGIGLSFFVTALAFALLHSSQLGNAWAPVLVLFLVSSVLTFTRAYTKSLASSFLVHCAYNSMLFGAMFFATDHFRHLEQIGR